MKKKSLNVAAFLKYSYPSIHPSIHPSIYLSIHPSVCLFIHVYSCVCVCVCVYIYTHTHCIYRVSQEERTKLREGVPYVKLYRYNPKHLYPKLNGYGDNGQTKVWTSCISAFYTLTAVSRAAPPTRSSDCMQSVRWLVLRRTSSTQRDKTVLHCC